MANPTRIERRMRALALSRDCAVLGARVRTIHHITGLGSRELLRLLFADREAPPRGRTPDTREWYHGANLLCRTEASVIVANFRRLREMGFAAGEALVCAYRYYRSVYQPPHRISFDRAFDLTSHTEGIWITRAPSFSLVECPTCAREFLDTWGALPSTNRHCPFCRLIRRIELDPRVRASFPNPVPLAREAALQWMHPLIEQPSGHDGSEAALAPDRWSSAGR